MHLKIEFMNAQNFLLDIAYIGISEIRALALDRKLEKQVRKLAMQ